MVILTWIMTHYCENLMLCRSFFYDSIFKSLHTWIFLTSKILKMCNRILVTLIKMQPQNSQYPIVKMQPHPVAHTQ